MSFLFATLIAGDATLCIAISTVGYMQRNSKISIVLQNVKLIAFKIIQIIDKHPDIFLSLLLSKN